MPDEYTGPCAEHLHRSPAWATTRTHAASVWLAVQQRYTDVDQASVASAVERAVALHGSDQRSDGKPYLEHVFAVANRVLQWAPAATVEMTIAALLHDSVEDHVSEVVKWAHSTAETERGRAFDALEHVFGKRVRTLAEHLTNPEPGPDLQRLGLDSGTAQATLAENAQYFVHFDQIFRGDVQASLIKLADFSTNAFCLHNLRDEAPQRYAKLLLKYRPCVALLRERLRASGPDDVFFPFRGQVLAELEAAWERDYASQ